MSISDTTRSLLLSFTLFAGAATAASTPAAAAETYEWSATLVSFDAASSTAVVQERVEAHADIEGLNGFTEGDRLILVWSGRSWAAGIRDLAQDPALTPQALTLPVEFVSLERDGEYVNFRIKVPASTHEKLADIDPGMCVRGESPRSGASFDDAVITLRHYNDLS